MKLSYLAAGAALLLAACGQPATTEEAPAAPQTMYDQVAAMAPEQAPIFAYQQLIAYQQAHPDAVPPCTAVRGTERITMPASIAPDSIYAAHAGSQVFSVQCGALISATSMDPNASADEYQVIRRQLFEKHALDAHATGRDGLQAGVEHEAIEAFGTASASNAVGSLEHDGVRAGSFEFVSGCQT